MCTIQMLRVAMLSTIAMVGACSPAAPPPATGSANEAYNEAHNETHDEAHDDPAVWTGCLFTRIAMVGIQRRPVGPELGLELVFTRIDRHHTPVQVYKASIDFAKEPAPNQPVAVDADVRDDLIDLETDGGSTTHYEAHGTIVLSADGATYDVTLASRQQPDKFEPGSPLAHFTAAVHRVRHIDDCTYK